jgi:hypothetical protein
MRPDLGCGPAPQRRPWPRPTLWRRGVKPCNDRSVGVGFQQLDGDGPNAAGATLLDVIKLRKLVAKLRRATSFRGLVVSGRKRFLL